MPKTSTEADTSNLSHNCFGNDYNAYVQVQACNWASVAKGLGLSQPAPAEQIQIGSLFYLKYGPLIWALTRLFLGFGVVLSMGLCSEMVCNRITRIPD